MCTSEKKAFCCNEMQIVPEVESFSSTGATFVDGNEMAFDAVIFATGYRSNVPAWLKVTLTA
jgi:indole-3-pyruvate monooxygenase